MSNLNNQSEIALELGRSNVKTARCFAGKIQVTLENGYTFYARKTNGDKYIGGDLVVYPYPWGIRYDGTHEDTSKLLWFSLRKATSSTDYQGTQSVTTVTDGYRATHEEAAAQLTPTPTPKPNKTTTLKLTPYQVDVLRFALYTQEQIFGEKIDNGQSQSGDMAERNCLSLLQNKLPEETA